MTTVMKAADSAEFLGLVPALAGCTPVRSIVLLPFEARRTHGALRMDLPDGDPPEFADQAVDLAARVVGTDALAVVVYCDERALETHDGLVLPRVSLVDDVLGAAEEQQLRLVDALCVTPEGWASYLDDDPVLHPLAEIPPLRGHPHLADLAGDQVSGAELPCVGLVATERVGRALIALDAVVCRLRDGRPVPVDRENPQALDPALQLDDIPALFERALVLPDEPDPFQAAVLIRLLSSPLHRDVALMQWASDLAGGDRTLASQLDDAAGGRMRADSAETIMGEGPRPDMSRLQVALRATRLLAALAPRPHRVGPLALAAWLSWALGRSTHAERYLSEIGRIAPGYSFARLLDELMTIRPLPEWLFERRGGAVA